MVTARIGKLQGKEIGRLVRFATVGAASTLVDFGLLLALKEIGGLPILAANSLSYSMGILTNFSLNRRWTFAEARSSGLWPQLARFMAVSLTGLALNSGIVWALSAPAGSLFSREMIGTVAAKGIATLVVMGWNYLANRYWTFKAALAAQQEG